METRLLDGKKTAEAIRREVEGDIQELKGQGVVPGLAVVLVGDNPASHVYVRNKVRTCAELGMYSEKITLDSDVSNDQLLRTIAELNARPDIDGILIQLPLPAQINEETILAAVNPEKDVDGFHPINVGKLVEGNFRLAPCTPMGIMEMLRREGVALKGADAVVVGRSNIVGKPMALLLLHAHATVTICHSRTRDLAAVCRRADILIAAVGRPALVTREFIRPGAVVVDVGINRIESREEVLRLFEQDPARLRQFEEKGSLLVGDVHPLDPFGIASAVTPVPGGVGPLTIAHLMKNTVLACRSLRAA